MWPGAQPDIAVGLEAERQVREDRIVPVIGELRILIAGKVETFLGTQFALGFLQSFANLAGLALAEIIGIQSPEFHFLGQLLQRFLFAAAQRLGRSGTRHDHMGMTLRIEVELAMVVGIFHHELGLRMDEGDVIAFVEIVLDQLPVEIALDRHPVGTDHLVHRIGLDLLGDRAKKFAQRHGILVHVDPDKACPDGALHRHHVELAARRTLDEIGFVRHRLQPPAELIGPAVIGAGQPLAAGIALFTGDQRHAAMLADIVEGADRAVLALDTDNRFRSEIGGDPVARLVQLRGNTGDLPGLGPDLLPFLVGPFLRRIAIRGYRRVAEFRLAQFRRIGPKRFVGLFLADDGRHKTISSEFSGDESLPS